MPFILIAVEVNTDGIDRATEVIEDNLSEMSDTANIVDYTLVHVDDADGLESGLDQIKQNL